MISEIISITVSAIISSGIAFAAGRYWERRSANIFRKNIAQDIYAFIDSCTDYQKSFIAYIAKEPKGSVFSPRSFEDKTFISFAVAFRVLDMAATSCSLMPRSSAGPCISWR